jgi:hypothetical protein
VALSEESQLERQGTSGIPRRTFADYLFLIYGLRLAGKMNRRRFLRVGVTGSSRDGTGSEE